MRIPRCGHTEYCAHKKKSRTWCMENCISKPHDPFRPNGKKKAVNQKAEEIPDKEPADNSPLEDYPEDDLTPEYLKGNDNG